MIDLKELAKAGVQFGHLTSRWCPKMKPVIWGQKNNIHLIDLSKTAYELEKAAKFLESVASQGKPILWVGTKKAAQASIEQMAQSLQLPYVTHRWIGGTLNNFSQVKKSVTKLLHYEDIIAKAEKTPELSHYTKKELSSFSKLVDRLQKNVGGIRKLTWPIGAIVVVDVKKEHVAIKEARSAGIPVVALVDTNGDPSLVDYVIPANDDAPRSINLLITYLGDAVHKGKEIAATTQQEEVEAEQTVEQLLQQAFGAEEEEAVNRPKRTNKAGAAKKAKRTPSNRTRSFQAEKVIKKSAETASVVEEAADSNISES